jgi:hypothetical protein
MPPSFLSPDVIRDYLRVFYFASSTETPIGRQAGPLGLWTQQAVKDQLIEEAKKAKELEECTTEESSEESGEEQQQTKRRRLACARGS